MGKEWEKLGEVGVGKVKRNAGWGSSVNEGRGSGRK